MDEADALGLFRRHDDSKWAEAPPDFDERRAVARFRAFVSALETAMRSHFLTETEALIQDASFHSQVNLGRGWLRFSAFGEMVSTLDLDEFDVATMEAVLRLCDEHGYVFVPPEFALLPYTGENPGVTGIRDWWIRFFDFI